MAEPWNLNFNLWDYGMGPNMPLGSNQLPPGGGWTPPSQNWGLPSPVQIMPGGTGGAASTVNAGNPFMAMGSPLRATSMSGNAAAGGSAIPMGPGPVQPAAQAAARSGVQANSLANAGGFLSRGLNLFGPAAGSRAARVGQFVGRHPYLLASMGPTVDQLLTGWTGNETLGNAGGMALTGGAIGAGVGGPIGAGIGAAIGGGAGLLGVNPSDIPLVGNVWDFLGGGSAPTAEGAPIPTAEDMQGTYQRVLTGLGADTDYVNRAWAQYKLSLELNPGLDEAQQAQLGQQVLQSAMSQLGIEQERQYYESNIAAVQAWMEPMLQSQLDRAQWYADNYAQMGQAAASEISNPALRDALMAQSSAYSAQQAQSNALALQQMSVYPEAFLGEIADAYEGQLAALQAQIDAGVMGGGYMQAPMPQAVSGVGGMGGASAPILIQNPDGSVQGTFPPWTTTSPVPGQMSSPQGQVAGAPSMPGVNSAPTGTLAPDVPTVTQPGLAPEPTYGPYGPPAPGVTYDQNGAPSNSGTEVNGEPVPTGTTLPYPVVSAVTGTTIPPGTPLPQGFFSRASR